MALQVVWSLIKKDIKREVAIYTGPATKAFHKRSSCRTRRVKVWTKEEIERKNNLEKSRA